MARNLSGDGPAIYQIKVQGRLDEDWSDWLNGMAVTLAGTNDGAFITTFTGMIADQSALRGLLCRLWDINVTLISVVRIETAGRAT